MLLELRIKDFAIIEKISLSFGRGLNIFTGETGAGKSIIIDAISLILGDRARGDIIRGGRDEAVVEAMFDVSCVEGINDILAEAGIEYSENLVIKRVVQKAGRNKIYINGSLATLMTLTEVGRHLIDIYGQSEHISLIRPEEHVELLDAFGGFRGLRDEMQVSYRSYFSIKSELDRLRSASVNSDESKDLLIFQIKELAEADLKIGEDASLRGEEERLKNVDRIKQAVTTAEREIYSEEGSVTERIGALLAELRVAAGYDQNLAKTVEAIEGSLYQLEDAAATLRDYGESIESDSGALDAVNSRLALIGKLKKKYGATIEKLLEIKHSFEDELANIAGYNEKIRELETKLFAVLEKAMLVANKLTEERGAAADKLKKKIEAELETLGMKGAVFEIVIKGETNPDGTPRLGEKGVDHVSFFISPNPGEEIKPLASIASGGELSRIMLAVKRVSAAGRVPTLVFDEIDTGVGGAMAQTVGLKLNEVSMNHQLICITHLPQIAAFADSHYSVTKGQTGEGRTVTTIRKLDVDARIAEISSMLGGVSVTETTIEHAKELCEVARRLIAERDSGGA